MSALRAALRSFSLGAVGAFLLALGAQACQESSDSCAPTPIADLPDAGTFTPVQDLRSEAAPLYSQRLEDSSAVNCTCLATGPCLGDGAEGLGGFAGSDSNEDWNYVSTNYPESAPGSERLLRATMEVEEGRLVVAYESTEGNYRITYAIGESTRD